MFSFYSVTEFGVEGFGEPDYRALKTQFAEAGRGDWVLMPPYPYGPNEALLDLTESPPNAPSRTHPFGTDDRGRDVFVRLAYGFNISMTFAIMVTLFSESAGVAVGALLGYFGGKLDIIGQRIIEIWSSLPFLYTIIIISSIVVPVYVPGRSAVFQPSFWLLVVILAVFDWVGITYYIRGEFYREKAKDYVGAAIATGVSRAENHVPAHPAECADAGRLVRAVRDRRQHQRARRARLPRIRPAGAHAELGRAHRPGNGEPDEMVAGVLPAGRAVRHPAARRLHRRSRP